MHSFFISDCRDGILDTEESAHAVRVLRLQNGEQVRLIDGKGHAFTGHLTDVQAGGTQYCIDCNAPARESITQITLYQGLPKADKLEWIVQKCTELGIYRIVPVEMRYCVAKSKKGGKDERLQRIAREAVKQCGRSLCPEVTQAMSFRDALKDMASQQLLCMPWEAAREHTLTNVLTGSSFRRIGILIGPEGGIAPEEAEALQNQGGIAVTLGERILRTETAAIASVALAVALTN